MPMNSCSRPPTASLRSAWAWPRRVPGGVASLTPPWPDDPCLDEPDRDVPPDERDEPLDDFFDDEARGFLDGPQVLMSCSTVPTGACRTGASVSPQVRQTGESTYGGPMSNPNQYGSQARGAAEGKAGGPQMEPTRGPTDRRDLVIAIGAIAAVVAGVLVLLFG